MNRISVSILPRYDRGAGVAGSAAGLVVLLNVWRKMRTAIFDPYRPELHYMRGPGPKWREKYTPGR
jgi:hypothetical protein